MAHDVNQCETDIAAQVRAALIEKISPERFDLWISPNTQWNWHQGVLSIEFDNDFTCQFAKRNLSSDLLAATQQVFGPSASVSLVCRPKSSPENASVQGSINPVTLDASRATLCNTNDSGEVSSVDPTHWDENGKNNPSAPVPTPSDTPNALNLFAFDSPTSDRGLSGRPAVRNSVNGSTRASLRVSEGQRGGNGESKDSANLEHSLWNKFVVGDSNQLAWASARTIVADPSRVSPVLFHGPCGVGKSHLLTAIAQHLRTHCRMRRVVHVTSEQFTNDFTESIKGGGLPMFRRKYRDIEAMLVDDIQFFMGKKATILELKQTLDVLLRANKQVIFTADRSVNDLNGLGSDIVGRLRGGLITPLLPIDIGTRAQILQNALADANLNVTPDIVRAIVAKTVGDGRVLHGIAKRLMIVAASIGGALTSIEQCWDSVFDLIQATQPVVRLGDIERVVCEVFNLPANSLQSASKIRTVAQPRMLAMFLARKYTPAAYKEIGDYFGNRRHSTVISAERTVEEWLRDNATLGTTRGMSVKEAIRHVESSLHIG